MKSISRTLATALVISLGSVSASQARIITDISPPTGPGLGGQICLPIQTPVNTDTENNDNSLGASPNQILNFPGLSCTPKTFEVIAPIDTRLFVQLSGGTTEYFFTETVVNDTDSTWTDFHFELGFDTGDNFRRFDEIPLPLNIAVPDFDTPNRDPAPTSSKFANLIHQDLSLWWSGGSVAPGETVDFTFSVDVPDDFLGLDLYNNFTIRQTPTVVPEPTSTLALLALGSIGAGSVVLRNRKQQD